MLKVICNQRDRFRARLRETEEVVLNIFSHFLLYSPYTLLHLFLQPFNDLTDFLDQWSVVSHLYCQEIRQLKEKIGMLHTELEKTKADNVKLYGKIRYVQDYNSEKVVSRGSKKVILAISHSLFSHNPLSVF